MSNLKIILFLCSWAPHAAYQRLQDGAAQIPAEIKMIRIPCTGRISKALLFKPFEMGADGVTLIGCKPGSCRYGTGTDTAKSNVEDTRDILELVGIGKGRLRWATFVPEESEAMLQHLNDFVNEIQAMGKTPVLTSSKAEGITIEPVQTNQILREHDIYACQDCGKCSSACPLTLSGKPFSPRIMANSIIAGDVFSETVRKDIWSCLTCGLCYERCPSGVNFHGFIRDMRHILKAGGSNGYEAHGGFFLALMRTMTQEELRVRHWEWLPDEVQIDPGSKTLFFGGCAPYFDTFFRTHLKIQTRDILLDGLRLLNFFDIYPALLSNERCCGHDLLWSGDVENFSRLARLNVNAIDELGIQEVITACPECFRTLSHDYPKHGIHMNFKVTHLFDLLEREIDKGAVGFKRFNHKITFQDPCRLSRLENRADLPRKLLSRLNPVSFDEMPDRGAGAICCGNCAWTGCDSFSKALQVKRIRQARETGSDLLVTACPKCQIHLRCAMEDPFLGEELHTEMMDLTSILSKTIKWE